jgi:hypothetical protein
MIGSNADVKSGDLNLAAIKLSQLGWHRKYNAFFDTWVFDHSFTA